MIETKVIDVKVTFLRAEEMVSSKFREVNGVCIEANPKLITTYTPIWTRYISFPVKILKRDSD